MTGHSPVLKLITASSVGMGQLVHAILGGSPSPIAAKAFAVCCGLVPKSSNWNRNQTVSVGTRLNARRLEKGSTLGKAAGRLIAHVFRLIYFRVLCYCIISQGIDFYLV